MQPNHEITYTHIKCVAGISCYILLLTLNGRLLIKNWCNSLLMDWHLVWNTLDYSNPYNPLLSHFSHVRLCVTPLTAAHQAPPSLGFSRQEHWSGLPFPSPMHESEKWKGSRSVVSDSSRPHGLQPTRLLCPWDFPGKSAGVGCHRLLDTILITLLSSCYSHSIM